MLPTSPLGSRRWIESRPDGDYSLSRHRYRHLLPEVTMGTPVVSATPTAVPVPWWKQPEVGKWLHSVTTFTGGLLLILIPILEDNLHSPTPVIALSETGTLLV